MIIANGYIRYVLSNYIPVQYNPLHFSYLSKERGEPVTKQGYAIFVEYTSGAVQSERIQLFNADMTEVGEFSTISVTPLDAVCQYKITI